MQLTSTPALIDIVVVNWNTGPYLERCLTSVISSRQQAWRLNSLVVVDNASSDASLRSLDQLPGVVKLVSNATNMGFAAACNQGFAACAKGDYLLLLNPDAQLEESSLDHMARFICSDVAREVGICGPQIIDDSGRPDMSFSDFPTLTAALTKMIGLQRLAPSLFRPHHEALSASGPVDQIIGACFLVRRVVYETLGGLDERFFMYFEDVDFSYRARQSGWASYFVREASVLHHGGISSRQTPAPRLYYSLRSRTIFAMTHWRAWKALFLVVATLAIEFPVRMIRDLAGAQRSCAAVESYRAMRWYVGFLVAVLTHKQVPLGLAPER